MKAPSVDVWLREAKASPEGESCGMFLTHNGTVRRTAKAKVRSGDAHAPEVRGLLFDYDQQKVDAAVAAARRMPGIFHVRVWLNRGELAVGDDIMLVLIGGDIRPRVVDALNFLVGELKDHCVTEVERN